MELTWNEGSKEARTSCNWPLLIRAEHFSRASGGDCGMPNIRAGSAVAPWRALLFRALSRIGRAVLRPELRFALNRDFRAPGAGPEGSNTRR